MPEVGISAEVNALGQGVTIQIMKSMKNHWSKIAMRAIGAAAVAGGILGLSGCASSAGGSGGTAALHDSSAVQGRDLGRGGATSGGLSSLDRSGNAADYSVYDARTQQ
jgi:hypothetical protein